MLTLNITLFKENLKENERDGNQTHMKKWERYKKFEWRNWEEGKFQRISLHSEKIKLKWILGKMDLKEWTRILLSHNWLLLHDFVDKVLTLQILYKSHLLDQIKNWIVGARNSEKDVDGVVSGDV